jgi:formate/nitrite transporter FocA (FNT family)
MKKIIKYSLAATVLLLTGCPDFLTENLLCNRVPNSHFRIRWNQECYFWCLCAIRSVNWYGASFVLDAEMRSGNDIEM